MSWKHIFGFSLIVFIGITLSQTTAIWLATGKTNNVGKFALQTERIVKDLDGKSVAITLSQIWPFDGSQAINLQIASKRQMDEYVVVIVDTKVLAAVQQPDIPKEQFSTTPNSKDVPKTVKLPSKLQLIGKMKLTYELIDNEWYLINVESLNLKAIPLD